MAALLCFNTAWADTTAVADTTTQGTTQEGSNAWLYFGLMIVIGVILVFRDYKNRTTQ